MTSNDVCRNWIVEPNANRRYDVRSREFEIKITFVQLYGVDNATVNILLTLYRSAFL
jgi:hypothetical protein